MSDCRLSSPVNGAVWIDDHAREIVALIAASPPSPQAGRSCDTGQAIWQDCHEALDRAACDLPVCVAAGRIGIARRGQEVGLRIWIRASEAAEGTSVHRRGWRDLTVWIDAEGRSSAQVLARCLLAADGPLTIARDRLGELRCRLASVTALTGYPDRAFTRAAMRAQVPESAPWLTSDSSPSSSPRTTAIRWSESTGPSAMA